MRDVLEIALDVLPLTNAVNRRDQPDGGVWLHRNLRLRYARELAAFDLHDVDLFHALAVGVDGGLAGDALVVLQTGPAVADLRPRLFEGRIGGDACLRDDVERDHGAVVPGGGVEDRVGTVRERALVSLADPLGPVLDLLIGVVEPEGSGRVPALDGLAPLSCEDLAE